MGLAPGTGLGPYEIVAPLGAGGMGEVYRARDTRLGRDVAVKVVHPRFASDPERLSRFEKEARAAAQLNHPNILVVHDVGTQEGSPFIVSELLQGESLREKLGAPVPSKKAVDWIIQVAQGLAAAHEKGIVHRDIKPENIFVTKDGHVKILDFGIAKLLPSTETSGVDTETPTASATQPGTGLGTAAYMSPEQVRGRPVDARSDLFSLGVVLYEMLSGKRPFQRDTVAEILTAILREDPPDLSETNRSVSAGLENVVRHCLEKEPDSRFQSARDVVFALEALSEVSTTKRPVPMSPAGVWLHRHGKSLGAAFFLALAVTGALIFASRKHSAASSGLPAILALPCIVYGAPEVAFLTDAVPGTISTLLSRVEGLDTKVPPSSLEVEKVKGDLTKLAALYQVSSFIVTSITTSPGRFALNVQLVDAGTRRVRWGMQYEGPRESYNELARQAADGIRLAVRPAASAIPTSAVSSEFELALREGAYFSNRYNNLHRPPDFDAGVAAFKRALESNPSSASAAAQIARLYEFRIEAEGTASGALKDAESWARRAVAFDPRSGEAWATLNAVGWWGDDNDPERLLEYALKAATFSPRDAFSHMAVSNSVQDPGTLSLSGAAARWAVGVDPFYLPASSNVAFASGGLGHPEEALPYLDRAMLVEPDAWTCVVARGYVLLKSGRIEEARKTLSPWEPRFFEHPEGAISQMWGQIRFLVAVAERDAGAIAKLEPYVVPQALAGGTDWIALGVQLVPPALARLGRTDEAIRLLLRYVKDGDLPAYDWLILDPDMQLLRGDPRFAKVLAASRDGAAKVAKILVEARARGELPKYLEKPLDDLLKLLSQKDATR